MLAAAMSADGVELHDQAAVDAWIAEFNALPYDERAVIVTDDVLDEATAVAAVELPEEDTARASAAQSPLLGQVRGLVDFLGAGRKLTQTAKLTLADARQLVTLLDTGDRFDPVVGDRIFKTTARLSWRSSASSCGSRPRPAWCAASKAGWWRPKPAGRWARTLSPMWVGSLPPLTRRAWSAPAPATATTSGASSHRSSTTCSSP